MKPPVFPAIQSHKAKLVLVCEVFLFVLVFSACNDIYRVYYSFQRSTLSTLRKLYLQPNIRQLTQMHFCDYMHTSRKDSKDNILTSTFLWMTLADLSMFSSTISFGFIINSVKYHQPSLMQNVALNNRKAHAE